MSKACGKQNFSGSAFSHLRDLGIDIDAERQPLVFDGGFVGRNKGQKGNTSNASQSYTGNRSEAGSRKGQRTSARRRSSCEAKSFGSKAHEKAFGDQFRVLARHYDALAFEDERGLWVAATTRPLGRGGPQAHVLIGMPFDEEIYPRAWAFQSVGRRAELFPLKHTNFPDASICAFTRESKAWQPKDGLLPLMDHYSLWMVKSWHRSFLGNWPGPQLGVCAYYRLQEFEAGEWCGCESGQRYFACHQFRDAQVPTALARNQFRQLFGGNYEDRAPPTSVMEASRSRWKVWPDMAIIFSLWRAADEPPMTIL
ncbi:hypothetical protein [Aurantiacibacter poecillastricola]|uniref:hypothetical protein n=1 Tax=Aurantiacibacter poecillastricola TaxID=3064385 RepID=UPI00273E3D5B|nr:hypothetical protein [Aurantiacibacter sp. 219JJ12-13]MDP5260814.1 hypothetical protein [Aurantiacibacter sp. 219JJ12-13]